MWTWPAHGLSSSEIDGRAGDDGALTRIHQPAAAEEHQQRPSTSSEVRSPVMTRRDQQEDPTQGHTDEHPSKPGEKKHPVHDNANEHIRRNDHRNQTVVPPVERTARDQGAGDRAVHDRVALPVGAADRASGQVVANRSKPLGGPATRSTARSRARSRQAVSGTTAANAASTSRSRQAVSGMIAAAAALRQLGTPYVWGGGSGAGATRGGFDCSGLALYAWARAGVSLPHYTGSQFTKGTKIPFSRLRPGDLVFFGGGSGDPTHVGIYLKDGVMVHAPKSGDVVRKVDFAHSAYYRSRYRGAIRPGK
ncbi:C40 family peptidase [Sphaerisporangium sp. NPDC088356]|uniref:C40 family peptidase n=1 Tax=Sphaerisporangium sp. NPDC088356 TaxID=3154871 RepID=UPI0034443422